MATSEQNKPQPDLTSLQFQLWHRAKVTRVAAARDLANCGQGAVETLSRAAAEADGWEIREAAVRSLGVIGGKDAVQALCGALADRHERVRLAAADALALVGDETAIEPLSTTLRRSFTGGSGRWQTFLTYAVTLTLVAFYLAMLYRGWQTGVSSVLLFGFGFCHIVSAYHSWRRKRSKFVRALTLALTAIAERAPRPELRTVLPHLRAVRADLLHQDPETRKASSQAVKRIEALTAALQALPIPMQPTGADAFPIPAANGAERSPRRQSVKSAKSVD